MRVAQIVAQRWRVPTLGKQGSYSRWSAASSIAFYPRRQQIHSTPHLNESPPSKPQGLPLHLYNTMTDQIQPVPSMEEGGKALAWYTCGPTTYAPAHMGHARTYVCLDIVRRVMEHHAVKAPLFVMNITDVDDKILAAATESSEGMTPVELARHFEAEFWEDLDSFNCLRPHLVTRVTECVDSEIVPYIKRLVDQGMAYRTEDGVYFDVRAYNERLGHLTKYGKLAPPSASKDLELTFGDKPTTSTNKRDPRDFVLWKVRKPNEDLWWESPWGDGRPGWHIECSAMIEAIQTKFASTHQFLVHAGGVDLKFPHHTNEIAQSEAYRQDEWIPHWVHTGHLHIDGLKMSKSLKNFVSIREFLDEYSGQNSSILESPADDFRLWCLGLSGSYRGPATFSRERIAEARTIRQKVLRFLIDGEKWLRRSQSAPKTWDDDAFALFMGANQAHETCLAALRNDVDGAKFVEEVVRVAELGNLYLSQQEQGPVEPVYSALSRLRGLLTLVGFSDRTTKAGLLNSSEESTRHLGDESPVIDAMVQFRSTVRQAALDDARNGTASTNMHNILKLCDEIRDQTLPPMGLELLDGLEEREGDGWRRCLPRLPVDASSHSDGQTKPATIDLASVKLEEFFRVGVYEGMFSGYTDQGIPTHNADGSEVSKRLLKKLLKKREAHKKRVEKARE